MDFSLWPKSDRPIDEVLDLAELADELDWHGYWFADHYMPDTGSTEFTPGDLHEAWTVLPAVAMRTSKVRLGPLVSPTSVHHPALLANRAVTLDHLSNGRMVLGLGAGWQINEHNAYGIELEPPGKRVSRFEESIQIVRSLLDNDRTTFDGEFYNFTDAPCDPSPLQEKLPILVGTSGPRMCGITAQHAQEWNTWGGPDLAGEKLEVFNKACEKVDVDPSSLRLTAQAMFMITDDAEKASSIMDSDLGTRCIVGTEDFIVEQLGRYDELGFDEVIVPDFMLGAEAAERRNAYERFSASIIPQL